MSSILALIDNGFDVQILFTQITSGKLSSIEGWPTTLIILKELLKAFWGKVPGKIRIQICILKVSNFKFFSSI